MIMKNLKKLVFVLFATLSIYACSKEDSNDSIISPNVETITNSTEEVNTDNLASTEAFYAENQIPFKTCNINYSTGGSFTTTQGTVVTIPPYAFYSPKGTSISGEVTIEFKDVYKKSDMVFNNLSTTIYKGSPLKSAGMFFIRARQGNENLQLIPGVSISIQQPLNGQTADPNMQVFRTKNDSVNLGWVPAAVDSAQIRDSLTWTPSNYVYSFYKFSTPLSSGTWCNSDNSSYFESYTQTKLTIKAANNYDSYNLDVYLIFSDVNSMIHLYQNWANTTNAEYIYNYAPIGLKATIVCVGVHNGKIQACFKPITISANMNIDFSLSEMKKDVFKEKLKALN